MISETDKPLAYRLWRRFYASKTFWPVVALALLVVYNIFFTKNFASISIMHDCGPDASWFDILLEGRLYGSIIDILRNSCMVMLLATGMTLVIATTGIDLSVGSVMAISGAVSAVMLANTNAPVPVIIACSLVVATLAGAWNGFLVSVIKLQPIVATLCLLVAGRGIARLITDDQIITISNKSFLFLGNGSLMTLPVRLLIVIGVVALTILITKKTVAGLYVEASGGNETASRLSGLNPAFVKTCVYAFSGFCAGIAGIFATANIKCADVMKCGQYIELDAILAVVIGGTAFTGGRANIIGSIVGALIMQTIETSMLLSKVRPEAILVVKAAAVIGVCLIQSRSFRRTITGNLAALWGKAFGGSATR